MTKVTSGEVEMPVLEDISEEEEEKSDVKEEPLGQAKRTYIKRKLTRGC